MRSRPLAHRLQGHGSGTALRQRRGWATGGAKMVNGSMHSNASPLPEIGHSSSRSLFRYWESIRGERSAPLRGDLQLQQICPLLPWMFISEPVPVGPGHRLRLAGTGVCELWGENMTGKDLFAAWNHFERNTMNKLLNSAIEDRHPFIMRCRVRNESGISATVEIMGLPVEADDTGRTQVLGLIVPFQDSELLRQHRLVSFDLVSVRIIWIEPLPEKQTCPKASRGKLAPHLQLVSGGRDGA